MSERERELLEKLMEELREYKEAFKEYENQTDKLKWKDGKYQPPNPFRIDPKKYNPRGNDGHAWWFFKYLFKKTHPELWKLADVRKLFKVRFVYAWEDYLRRSNRKYKEKGGEVDE